MEVKQVCFVRHAKSSWNHPNLRDFDRPLDERGLHDAPMMASKMSDLGLYPDFIITSGAMRAKTTAGYFKAEANLPDDKFVVTDSIYEAGQEAVYEALRSAPDTADFVFVFGHNPTFTYIANSIAGVSIDNVPTCGIVHAQLFISSWKDFRPDIAGFIGFHYPKQYKS